MKTGRKEKILMEKLDAIETRTSLIESSHDNIHHNSEFNIYGQTFPYSIKQDYPDYE